LRRRSKYWTGLLIVLLALLPPFKWFWSNLQHAQLNKMHKLCVYTCLNTAPNSIYVICEPVSRSYWVIFCEWNFNCISYVCVVCSPDLIDVTYKPVTAQLIHLLVLSYIAPGLPDQIMYVLACVLSSLFFRSLCFTSYRHFWAQF
jgi:hypothetical protein